MGPNLKRWRVRNQSGKISGPFSTEQILAQIQSGHLSGGEHVALESSSKWIAIEKTPEFYDLLLDVLSQSAKKVPPLTESRFEPEARSGHPQSSGQIEAESNAQASSIPDPVASEKTELVVAEPVSVGIENGIAKSKTNSSSNPNAISATDLNQGLENVIELKSSRGSSKNRRSDQDEDATDSGRDRARKTIAGLSLLFASLGLAYFAYLENGSGPSASGQAKVRLIAPRANQPVLPIEKVKEKYARARGGFESDILSGYQQAQIDLVEIAEGLPKTAEIAAQSVEIYQFLCLTYRELWPYAFQDSTDLKVVKDVLVQAKSLDPSGISGATCEIVQHLLTAKFAEADRLAESKLKEDGQAAVLFELRGDAYLASGDAQSAVNYFERARLLWPAWLKPSVSEARAHVRLRQYGQAVSLLKDVVVRSANHVVALIELGLIEYSQFDHQKEAVQHLNQAFATRERAPASLASRGQMVLAQIALKRGDRKNAITYAERALDLFPANSVAREFLKQLGSGKAVAGQSTAVELVALGDEHARSGDCIQAQAEYRAAFDIDPKMGVAALKAGKCLWNLNQATEAIEWMRKAITAEPSLTPAYVDLADYYAQRYDFANAFKTLQRIQQMQPKNYEVLRGYGLVELRRNNFDAAVKYATRALQIYNSDLETLQILAKAHLGLKDFQSAQGYASRILETDSSHTEGHVLLAKVIAGQQGPDLGVDYLEKLLNRIVVVKGQSAPVAAVRYRVAIAELCLEYDRLSQAEAAARQAVSIDGNSKEALMMLGRVLQIEARFNDSLEYFLKAAVLDPSDADPLFLAGQVYIEVGRIFEAINMLNRVIRVNPRYPRAHVALGRAQLKQGQTEAAIKEAQAEKEINPGLSDAYILQAEAHFVNKQYSDCASEYQKAVTRRAQPPLVLVKMARCYRLSGALDSAQSLLRRAQSIESGNPEIYKEQGAVFQLKGLADEAIASYELYLRLVPTAADRTEVEARISRVRSGDLTLED